MLGDLPFGLIIYYGHAPPRLKWPIPRAGRGARPSTVATALILLYPLLYGFFISLFDTNLLSKWEFVFLDNYVSIVEDGGQMGVRDNHLIESALARPIQRWNYA